MQVLFIKVEKYFIQRVVEEVREEDTNLLSLKTVIDIILVLLLLLSLTLILSYI